MATRWRGMTSEDRRVLQDDIAGLKPVPSNERFLGGLSAYQINRVVNLRKIIVQYRVPTSEHGKYAFSLETLKALDEFTLGESNQIQKVAYRNRINKIKDDLVIIRTMQDDLQELIQSGAPESSIDVARDEIEELGREVSRSYLGLINILQEDILQRKGLAASSMYRASLTNERQMYAMLEKDGMKMRRKWNDVLLEVRNLLSATNHDAKAKTHLERMRKDLEQILFYLDDYALLPFLAPRDVVAQIVLINRRLNDYQDEYDLSQSDTERVANVIDDRETRDEMRAKIAEKTLSFFDAIGYKRLSIGGLYRGARAIVRGTHKTVRFVTRTLPNLVRSGWTAVRTTPQRIKQTVKQGFRAVEGLWRATVGRAVGLISGKGQSKRLGVDWNDPLSQEALAATISRGYRGGGNLETGSPTAVMPDGGSGIDAPLDEAVPTPANIHDQVVSETSNIPGSTSTRRSDSRAAGVGGMAQRLDVFDLKLDLILRSLNSGKAPTINVTTTGAAQSENEGELASLQRSEELDLLKSISASLEKVVGRMDGKGNKPDREGGIMSMMLGKLMSIKNWVGTALKAIGSWKVISKGIGFITGTLKVLGRIAGPLLRLGGFVGRILLGPVGALLGAGAAGWAIGKAIYGKYSEEIGALIDGSVGLIKDSVKFIEEKVDKVFAIIGDLKTAWSDWRAKGKEKAQDTRRKAVQTAVEADMKNYEGLTPETRKMAEAVGVDVSMHPTWDPKTGKVSQPAVTPPKPVTPPESKPASSVKQPDSKSSATSAPPVARSTQSGVVQAHAVSLGPRTVSNSSVSSPSTSSPATSVYGDSAAPVPAVSSNLYRAAADANMGGLQPHVRSNFEAMVTEYKQRGGKYPVSVNRAFASYEQQAALFKKYGPGRAARPGRSAHNYGVAIDIDSPAANEMARMGLLDKYGFDRPVKGEPWHLQVKGVSAAMARQGIYSADTPSAQGDTGTFLSADSGGSQQAPSVLATADAGNTNQPETRVKRENGKSAEAAAYNPKSASSMVAKDDTSAGASAPSTNTATPSGHGTTRIPEFSYGDPTFFALNLGALSS